MITDLSYEEAHEKMLQGMRIKLPEWVGFWFYDKSKTKIKVLTVKGIILNTPHIEKYKHRNDWQAYLYPEGVGFDKALQALKKGAIVTRSEWRNTDVFVFLRPEDYINVKTIVDVVKSLPVSVKNFYKNRYNEDYSDTYLFQKQFKSYLCKSDAKLNIENGWTPSNDDLLSDDWHVIAHEAKNDEYTPD